MRAWPEQASCPPVFNLSSKARWSPKIPLLTPFSRCFRLVQTNGDVASISTLTGQFEHRPNRAGLPVVRVRSRWYLGLAVGVSVNSGGEQARESVTEIVVEGIPHKAGFNSGISKLVA